MLSAKYIARPKFDDLFSIVCRPPVGFSICGFYEEDIRDTLNNGTESDITDMMHRIEREYIHIRISCSTYEKCKYERIIKHCEKMIRYFDSVRLATSRDLYYEIMNR